MAAVARGTCATARASSDDDDGNRLYSLVNTPSQWRAVDRMQQQPSAAAAAAAARTLECARVLCFSFLSSEIIMCTRARASETQTVAAAAAGSSERNARES